MPGRAAHRALAATGRAAGYLILLSPLSFAPVVALAVLAAGRDRPGTLAAGVILLAAVLLALGTAGPQRRAVSLLGDGPVPAPEVEEAASTARGGPVPWRRLGHAGLTVVLAPVDLAVVAVWPMVAAALLMSPLAVAEGPVTLGPVTVERTWQAWVAFGTGLLAVAGWAVVCTGLARVHAAVAAALLGPRGAALQVQVAHLTRSRRRLVDSFDGERQRIERDLHDGVQQHLVALGMTLDLARLELQDAQRGQAAELVERAHAQTLSTLQQLRDLVQGIHPPVLTELGLPAAIQELVDRSGLPVTVGIDLPGRAAATVETAAYFVVAEALTNAARHSRASAVRVRLAHSGDQLVVEVGDDGAGGAEPRPASGLSGLADRVAALGGRLTLSSPPGGPTVLTARLPAAGWTGATRP